MAQEGPPSGTLTRAPTLRKSVEAEYPEEAFAAQQTGTVQLEIDIDADGKVIAAQVTQPAGFGFDEAALKAVQQFEFTPAEVDGKPAAVRIGYAYEFVLRKQVVASPQVDVVNFEGVLLERGTRRPIPNASVVVLSEPPQEASSDSLGRFSMTNVPWGTHAVVVMATEFSRYEVQEDFRKGSLTRATYFVRREVYSPFETVVREKKEKKEVAQVTLKQEEVRLIPGTQGDAFKVVQNLPGVARTPFSLGALVVRGSKPWDSRTYVDNTHVPQLFHFGGLYATFNANLLEDISFQPGNFPAEYGRSIGGLVTARTRTPAKDGVHGYFDINLIDSSLLLEGPIGGDWSLAVAGRRSYIDVTLPWGLRTFFPRADEVLSFTVAPRYYDYQVKLEHRKRGSRDRFFVMLFGSDDVLSAALPNPALDPEGRGNFNSHINYNRLSMVYEKQLHDDLRFTSTNFIGLDRLNSSVGADIFFNTQLFPFSSREMLEWNVPKLALTLYSGLDFVYMPYQYEVQRPPPLLTNQIPNPFLSRQLLIERASVSTLQPALFFDAVWKPTKPLKVVLGARGDYDSQLNDAWVDPRVSLFYELSQATTLTGAWGQFHQTPDYRQGLLSPTFGNPQLLPEGATHYSLGVEHRFNDSLSLNVQGYYKYLFGQSQTQLAATSTAESNVGPAYTSTGRGRNYGVEILLRQQLTQRLFGWIAYSLSRAERFYRRTQDWGLNPLDQTHNLILVASYKLPHDWIAGVRLRYATGALNTPFVGAVYDANGNYHYPLPGEPWSRRLPDFFQLDVRVDKRFVFNQWILALYADIQNATNYGNVEGVLNNFDYTEEQFLYGLPIIPSLGVRGEF